MHSHLIITNFKTYPGAVGKKAVELAKIHEKVAKETGANLAVAVNFVDLKAVCDAVDIPVFAQHFDAVDLGAFTGFVPPEVIKEAGAYGAILNHSEHLLDFDLVKRSIFLAKKEELFVVVCAENTAMASKIAEFDVDMIALEPPDLIGGDISISTARPDLIRQCVEKIGCDRLLVGAGVKNRKDVEVAMSLGACGVLLASGVAKAADPEAVLRDLVLGLGDLG
jgi:triosephosphate isomerase